jgi:CrcB protein
LVLAGGLLGSSLREVVVSLLPPSPFPVANLTANLIGSFFLGWLVARRERHSATGLAISFWGIGVLGSFTTFSGFSVAALDLMRTGRLPAAAGYVAASVIGGLFSARTGLRLGDRR